MVRAPPPPRPHQGLLLCVFPFALNCDHLYSICWSFMGHSNQFRDLKVLWEPPWFCGQLVRCTSGPGTPSRLASEVWGDLTHVDTR